MTRPSSLRPGAGAGSSRHRVLVIDDDDALCAAVREALRDRYAVATAPHGAAALELMAGHEPAVILLDLRMPIMDGWSFVEHYRRMTPVPAPIILMSAARDLPQLARQLGLAGVLPKPFELDDLVAIVAAQIRPRAIDGRLEASVAERAS